RGLGDLLVTELARGRHDPAIGTDEAAAVAARVEPAPGQRDPRLALGIAEDGGLELLAGDRPQALGPLRREAMGVVRVARFAHRERELDAGELRAQPDDRAAAVGE